MRLTKNLRAAIVRQFRDGAGVDYLARIYDLPATRIEHVIRVKILEIDERLGESSLARLKELKCDQ